MEDKSDGIGAGLAVGALQHGFGEIYGGDTRAGGGQAERVTASAAADIRHRQPRHITGQGGEVPLFKQDQRIILAVIELGPAVITGLGRQDFHIPRVRTSAACLSLVLHVVPTLLSALPPGVEPKGGAFELPEGPREHEGLLPAAIRTLPPLSKVKVTGLLVSSIRIGSFG